MTEDRSVLVRVPVRVHTIFRVAPALSIARRVFVRGVAPACQPHAPTSCTTIVCASLHDVFTLIDCTLRNLPTCPYAVSPPL